MKLKQILFENEKKGKGPKKQKKKQISLRGMTERKATAKAKADLSQCSR